MLSPAFDPDRVACFLAAASDANNVAIGGFELLAGGAIGENWGFRARFAGGRLGGEQALVLRTDAPTGIASSLGRIEEFAVLRAAHAAGVRVPEPLFGCADASVIGRPFFVMRRVGGTAQGRAITADPAFEPWLPAIAARLAEELARLQTIRPPCRELSFLPVVGPAEHLASFRAYLDRHPHPRPVLEWAIRWLETHLPEPLPPVLCHRDFRSGNYLAERGAVTGILDWEFAGWGDPDEDIGWFCCKGWRFARLDREAGGIAERAVFYAAYERASGRRLDPQRVRFWEVLANVRWAVIALQQSNRYLLGGQRDLSTAIIGRRASECDLELLMLLDPQDTPSPPSGERDGVRGQTSAPMPAPLPSHAFGAGPSLSCDAGEGSQTRDLPGGAQLLELGQELLLGELLPLLPAEHERAARLIATAMMIAAREMMAGDGPAQEIEANLIEFYGPPASCRQGAGHPEGALLARFAADLRRGAFEACEGRARAARALLWRLTILKLREGNPGFLAANGFGE